MRYAIVLLIGVAVGAGGMYAYKNFDLASAGREDVERKVAEVATERDNLDVDRVACRERPYPEGEWRCTVYLPGEVRFVTYNYQVSVDGNRIEVGSRKDCVIGQLDC